MMTMRRRNVSSRSAWRPTQPRKPRNPSSLPSHPSYWTLSPYVHVSTLLPGYDTTIRSCSKSVKIGFLD